MTGLSNVTVPVFSDSSKMLYSPMSAELGARSTFLSVSNLFSSSTFSNGTGRYPFGSRISSDSFLSSFTEWDVRIWITFAAADWKALIGFSGVERWASGIRLECRASGNTMERRASGNGVERRASANGVEGRASGNEVERRASANGVEGRTSGNGVERRASANGVERRASGTGVECRASDLSSKDMVFDGGLYPDVDAIGIGFGGDGEVLEVDSLEATGEILVTERLASG